jgi:2-polyprenyl-3-methyl-5-hydroxy-6-metoxy-1,4-benzoquinol methylase
VDNINTQEYWDKRFEKDGSWEKNYGREQSKFFAKLILDNIPEQIYEDILHNNLSIADIGCALGDLCLLFKGKFPNSKIYGYDFSVQAVARCLNKYREYEKLLFLYGEMYSNKDVVVLSNILEHIENPMDFLKNYIDKSDKYCIVLSPYKGLVYDEHINSFDETSFPRENLVFVKVIKEFDPLMCGDQILLLYEKG